MNELGEKFLPKTWALPTHLQPGVWLISNVDGTLRRCAPPTDRLSEHSISESLGEEGDLERRAKVNGEASRAT